MISAPVHSKDNNNNNNNKKTTINSTNSNIKRNYIVVPYTKGLCKSIKIYIQETWHTCILQRGQDHHRPSGTQR